MKVRLLKTFPTLGQVGDVVNVSQGHAFNYLLPKKIISINLDEKILEKTAKINPTVLTPKNKSDLHKTSGLRLEIKAKANDQGKLYESIKPGQVAQLIRQRKNIDVTAKQIFFSQPIKQIGNYELLFKLSNQTAKFNLIVTKL